MNLMCIGSAKNRQHFVVILTMLKFASTLRFKFLAWLHANLKVVKTLWSMSSHNAELSTTTHQILNKQHLVIYVLASWEFLSTKSAKCVYKDAINSNLVLVSYK